MQAAIGAGVEDTREVRQRLVALEGNVVKMQRAEDKRAVEVMQKVSEQEVCHPPSMLTAAVQVLCSYLGLHGLWSHLSGIMLVFEGMQVICHHVASQLESNCGQGAGQVLLRLMHQNLM